jgi:glycosyltransferase involved in cell wall biosynthesis
MRKPIKALFVFPISQIWGGENVWLEFLARVNRNRVLPVAFVFGEGELLKRSENIKVSYYLLPKARLRNIFISLKNLFLMIRFLKKERFDVVNSLGVHLLTTLTTSILNIPYILHIHTIHPLPLIDRWCLRKARHIVTVSNFSKNFLIGYGIKPEIIEVIYNGIDIEDLVEKIRGIDLRKELCLDGDEKIVCYIGRIVKWKNLDFLIKAIPKVKENYEGKVRFLFVGDTPERDMAEEDYKGALLRLAKELGAEGEIMFTGRREDVVDILKNIDIFALPSHLETFPMSVLEAMGMGRPVVAIKVGGIPELVTSETGILVEPGDLDGFTKAIIDLLRDKEKRQKMSKAGCKRIKEFFSIEYNVNKLEYILENVY